ncbi:hypothetical protein [Gimesia fumaroli]|jgi:hypothetical protein|uniref:Uncharacterized protein n=1 Tax=Gimesia fumaroli TaxID=2527976 RepID=A0A518IC81_9PLAN|nr:hypothetical protein [Gimesia fumaroli]QDV50706.1 hypothetical protein Enr17x_27490 [Gimesia fumaroli]
MSNRGSYFAAILLCFACTQAGCRTIPDYHQPAGFSSTYHQAIYPETAIASLSDDATKGGTKDQGVFYPTDVKVRQPKYVAPLAEIKSRISSEDLKNEQRKLQFDSLRRADDYINQEQIYNENFPAPSAW